MSKKKIILSVLTGIFIILVFSMVRINITFDKTPPSMMLQEVTLKKGDSVSFSELEQKSIQSLSDNKDSNSDIKVEFTTMSDIVIDSSQMLDTKKKETQVYKIKATDSTGNVAEDTINVNIE